MAAVQAVLSFDQSGLQGRIPGGGGSDDEICCGPAGAELQSFLRWENITVKEQFYAIFDR